MKLNERIFIAMSLLGISFLTLFDLITDFNEGVTWWHISIEGVVALIAGGGFVYLLISSFKLKNLIANERELSDKLKIENERYKQQSKRYIEGLSSTIEAQLSQWDLSKSEKEIAFLLLKGLSLKEVAQVRGTTEKTARTQSASIYSKAGLANRSQLAAFFLEDLLLPSETTLQSFK